MSENESSLIVFCTVPDTKTADAIIEASVVSHLAACANLISGITSTYWWEGKLCKDQELLVIMKTTSERFEKLQQAVLAVHPYKVPEITAVKIQDAYPPYLKWIEDSVRPEAAKKDN